VTARARIILLVATALETSVDELNPDSSPDTVDTWDSSRHLNLIVALEDAFGIEISDEQVFSMLTLEAVLATVLGLAGEKE